MKILHLVTSGDVAGGQLVALRLAQAARDRGDEAAFVSPGGGPFVELAAADGFRTFFVDVSRLFRLRAALQLSQLLHDQRADVLHTHVHLAAGVLGRLAARIAHVPVVAHMHIENHFRPQRAAAVVSRALDNRTARWCARILAVSDDTRRAFERQGYPAALMETVYNGIDVPPRSNGAGLRAELGLPADAPLAGEIARLCDVKGQRELIRAAASVPELRVVLVGEDLEAGGAFRAGLEREATELGVADRVRFTGYRDDADALLDELDVFVLPSWIEGLPLTVLEAMAHGKPVVATGVGGTPELVVDGETGVLVPPRDPDALAAALRELAADPDRARRLGEAGRRRVEERFSAEAMTSRVLAVYDELLARRDRSGFVAQSHEVRGRHGTKPPEPS